MNRSANNDERVVWVTGSSSGIGEAIALELARRGYKLILSARRLDRLEEVRYRCADPARVAVFPIDVSETEKAENNVASAWQAFGRVDAIVHSAGISQRSYVADTKLDVDRRLMEVNYFGVVALTKAALPKMLEQGGGHLVVISSVVGYVGTPRRSAYSASKHALHGFFESLRAEMSERSIDITMVCPGYIATDISFNALRGDGKNFGVREDLTARGMSPEECSQRVVDAFEAKQPELYVGRREIAAIYLRRFVPSLLRRVLPRIPQT